MSRSCQKTISARHGFVVKAVPTVNGWDWFSEPSSFVVKAVPTVNGWDWFSEPSSYAAVLDCVYEMALDLVGANAITPAAAVAQVMVDENWKVLPTHVKAIIKRVEED